MNEQVYIVLILRVLIHNGDEDRYAIGLKIVEMFPYMKAVAVLTHK